MSSFPHDTHSRLEQQRQQLENLLHQGNCEPAARSSLLHKFWFWFIDAVSHWLTVGDEPRISLSTVGDVEVWNVYDPVARSVRYFTTENDVRVWLDQRYHP